MKPDENMAPVSDADAEAYIARRLELHRLGGRSLTLRLPEGRWVLIRDHRLPDGGTRVDPRDTQAGVDRDTGDRIALQIPVTDPQDG